MPRAFIAIGSNIAPAANVRKAIHALLEKTRVIAISTIYRTEPERHPDHPPFYNGVLELETGRSPEALKFGLLRPIEAGLGRQRTSDKDAPRTIDLDLLLYGDLVLKTGCLTLPDPDIADRAVIAIPLTELAPDLVLPGTLTTISMLASRLSQTGMIPLTHHTAQLKADAGFNLRESLLLTSLSPRRTSAGAANRYNGDAPLLNLLRPFRGRRPHLNH
jgi:2-amino-4-hydroxy-6-hydroxymethyldihydropteridine diphosphokinase